MENRKLIPLLYLTITFTLILTANLLAYFQSVALLITINIANLIILITSSIFHFALSPLFRWIRRRSEETYVEHFALLFIGVLVYIFYRVYLIHEPIDSYAYFFAIFYICPFIYLLAATFFIANKKHWFPIDILSQISLVYFALLIAESHPMYELYFPTLILALAAMISLITIKNLP
jgi:hypothetical protein